MRRVSVTRRECHVDDLALRKRFRAFPKRTCASNPEYVKPAGESLRCKLLTLMSAISRHLGGFFIKDSKVNLSASTISLPNWQRVKGIPLIPILPQTLL